MSHADGTESHAAAKTRHAFGPADDHDHFALLGNDHWATETAWFSFHHPERRLGGWFYTLLRPNLGTVAGGVWIWDDSAHLPWEVPYSTNYSALPIPAPFDLADCALPTGACMRVLEPCTRYALRCDDAPRLVADLEFTAVMPPEPLTAVGSTFGNAHHFDQFGRVTGHLVLHGERIDIDCIGMRDRTWGRRPEDRPRKAAYVTGTSDAANGFLAVTDGRGEPERIAYGFLRRDGRTVALAEGTRSVERDAATGFVRRVRIEARDNDGRTLRAEGEPVSRIVLNRHSFIDIDSLVRWTIDGAQGWGEDQDMWPMHRFAAFRRDAARNTR